MSECCMSQRSSIRRYWCVLALSHSGFEMRANRGTRLGGQQRIKRAKRRIFFASLYVGKEEQELVRLPVPCHLFLLVKLTRSLTPAGRRPALLPLPQPLPAPNLPSRLPPLNPRVPQTLLRFSPRDFGRRVPETGRFEAVPYARTERVGEETGAEEVQ